jgi:hypothetical protein
MRWLRLAAGCLLALSAGCGPDPDPPVDVADAAAQLRRALDAWKAGEPFAALAEKNPPIVFNEPLWRDGATLVDYELGEVLLHGRQGTCKVKLTVRQRDGKSGERRIGYQIDTTPNVVIAREGLGP